MKVTIDAKGCLKVQAESGMESYALQKWSEGFIATTEPCESMLCIETKFEAGEPAE